MKCFKLQEKIFLLAEKQNEWFESDFITLKKGDALNLPVENNSIDVAAQNCLFNIFKMEELKKALKEMYRVIKPNGRLVMSDPICEQTDEQNLEERQTLESTLPFGINPLS